MHSHLEITRFLRAFYVLLLSCWDIVGVDYGCCTIPGLLDFLSLFVMFVGWIVFLGVDAKKDVLSCWSWKPKIREGCFLDPLAVFIE